ncbi:hypothetical protein [Hyphomicrobium sp. DY-1]|uniref:hypothetical protein n=1 Tax=Hyphomicrobium sp. DY-1 TaxID=3075650 RepID=UPI0039C497E0
MSDALHRSEMEFLLFGKRLGAGLSRTVYELNDPSCWGRHKDTGAPMIDPLSSKRVIKVEKPGGMFQNVQEWTVWEWARGTPMAKWFAPCISISPCGLYLIQDKVEPLRRKDWPKKLPAFLQDVEPENFGLLNGKVVACDYGCGVAAIRSANKRMMNVKPWPKS